MMKIRYLKDGVGDISDDTEVIAEGLTGYYVATANPDELKYVPREFVVSRFHRNSNDFDAPNIFSLAEEGNIHDIDFSLSEIFKTVH